MPPQAPIRSRARGVLAALVAAPALAAPALAGGTPEAAALIIDPTDPVSLRVANAYRAARNIPEANILYQRSEATDYPAFVSGPQASFQGTLSARGVLDRIDYAILAPTSTYYVQATGLISDSCSPVTLFSITTAYTLALSSSDVFTSASGTVTPTGNDSTFANRYYLASGDAPAYFSSQNLYNNGSIVTAGTNARRYYLAALLGYTGSQGNTVDEVLTMVSRSAAVDGTRTSGTGGGAFAFMSNTSDPSRNVRAASYAAAISSITGRGGSASQISGVLPSASNYLGVMTGAATLSPAANLLAPGAFADHLTSFAGAYWEGSQTKHSVWIRSGASGTSGAVEEPCNYTGKFPNPRLHAWYFQGMSLGEAFFRSLQYVPFQLLFVGDPLTRPFARFPTINAPALPASPVAGSFSFTPGGSATAPGSSMQYYDLYIDGVRVAGASPNNLITVNTATLDDGWHDLRLLGRDSSTVRNIGRWIGSLTTSNFGRSAGLAVNTTTGDLSTRFTFTVSAAGFQVREARLISNGAVIAASAGDLAPLSVFGQTLGAGSVPVRAEVVFADRRVARSAPITLTINNTGGTGAVNAVPTAYSFTRRIAPGSTQILEFPLASDAPLNQIYVTPTNPTQATLESGYGRFRRITANAAATGSETIAFSVWVPNGGGRSNDATITLQYSAPTLCALDYNADGSANLDDLGDFITDFYTLPAIPAGPQPAAPSLPGLALPGMPCPAAGDAPAPYSADAYRRWGFRAGFSGDGSNLCPIGPTQGFPNLDNLSDFITAFYDTGLRAACP